MAPRNMAQLMTELTAKGITPDLSPFANLKPLGEKVYTKAIETYLRDLADSADAPARDWAADFLAVDANADLISRTRAILKMVASAVKTERERGAKLSVVVDLNADEDDAIVKLVNRNRAAVERANRNYNDLGALLIEHKIAALYYRAVKDEEAHEIKVKSVKPTDTNTNGVAVFDGKEWKPIGMLPSIVSGFAKAAVASGKRKESTVNTWATVRIGHPDSKAMNIGDFYDENAPEDTGDE